MLPASLKLSWLVIALKCNTLYSIISRTTRHRTFWRSYKWRSTTFEFVYDCTLKTKDGWTKFHTNMTQIKKKFETTFGFRSSWTVFWTFFHVKDSLRRGSNLLSFLASDLNLSFMWKVVHGEVQSLFQFLRAFCNKQRWLNS